MPPAETSAAETSTADAARVRRAVAADLDALNALEQAVFATDCMSRRSIRRLLASPSAAVLVAEHQGRVAGAAVVLTRAGCAVARLYSIAVDPASAGHGLGPALLAAAEAEAAARGCRAIRLEVHETNARAIARYRRAGFREFGRHVAYYEDKGDALRFEKALVS
nr:GNAT family N-acetyltransferase [Rhodoplanes tepidamans]